jgi:hypothetical protein
MASLWNRVRAALGFRPSTGDVALEDDRIVLRELERAKILPQEPREPGRKEMTACERCSGPLRQVVFTTAGSGAQREIWRQYPLAVDGWVCPGCGWAAMPRFISAAESAEYGRAGAEHAANGRFDDAEFWFRRIVGSWPGYPAGYADLGQLASARADAAEAPEDKRRFRAESASWLRRAVEADAEGRVPRAREALARALALTGDERGALELLDALARDPATAAPLRAEAEGAMAGIREGRALFQRATEMVGSVVLEPPSLPVSPARRRDLEAAEALLGDAADRSGAFRTSGSSGRCGCDSARWRRRSPRSGARTPSSPPSRTAAASSARCCSSSTAPTRPSRSCNVRSSCGPKTPGWSATSPWCGC